MNQYCFLQPGLLKKTFEKVKRFLPDFLRSFDVFVALYQDSGTAFFEVGAFGGVFWLSNISLGQKAVFHLVLWDDDDKSHYFNEPGNAKRVIRDIFNLFGLHRLETYIPIRMTKTCELAEEMGFSMEGIMRKAGMYDGELVDIALYSLLKEEL